MRLKEYQASIPRQNWRAVERILEEKGPMTPRQIADALGWTVTKAQSILQRMKDAGYAAPQKGWVMLKRLD